MTAGIIGGTIDDITAVKTPPKLESSNNERPLGWRPFNH
jgi:hypothetical protein